MQSSGSQHETLNMEPGFDNTRRYIQEKIYCFLMQRQNTREVDPKKVIDIVRSLEEGLFKTATTKEEYMNIETLENRLLVLIRRLPLNNHNPQYQQGTTSGMPQSGNSSIMSPSSMVTMVQPFVNTENILPNSAQIPGILQSSSRFALDDIDDYVNVKKEKAAPLIPKPTAPMPHSKNMTNKKRKSPSDVVEVEPFDDMENGRSLSKLYSLMKHGMEQMNKCFGAIEKRVEEAEAMVEDLRKIAAATAKNLEKETKENAFLKKKLDKIEADHNQELERILDEVKRSAALTVMQARIQMAEQAEAKGFDILAWDVQGWRKTVVNFGGEVAEQSGKDGDEIGEKKASQGNEGSDAKT